MANNRSKTTATPAATTTTTTTCVCGCKAHHSEWIIVSPPSRGSNPMGHYTVTILLFLLLLGPIPTHALCQDRCERVVPMMANLRALWSRSFKRVGERRVSFEEFLMSLVQASTNGAQRTQGLSDALMNLVGRYQDCVMACEHPFSKRGAESLARYDHSQSAPRDARSFSQLCREDASTLLARLCMSYGIQQ